MDLQKMNVDAVAKAIEDDLGEFLPDLKQALQEAKAGIQGRVTTPEQMLIQQVRKKSGLSQSAFAKQIDTPVATLQDWEQGRFKPPGGVLCLFRLIDRHPELSSELRQGL